MRLGPLWAIGTLFGSAVALGRPLAPGSDDAVEPASASSPSYLTTNDYGTQLLYFDVPALALLSTWTVVLYDKYQPERVGWQRNHDDSWIGSIGALAFSVYLIPGPVIHGVNNRDGRASESFWLRLGGFGAGAVTGLVGATLYYCFPRLYECRGGTNGGEILYWTTAGGGLLGAATALVFDDYLLEKSSPHRLVPATTALRPTFSLEPHAAHLGIQGAF